MIDDRADVDSLLAAAGWAKSEAEGLPHLIVNLDPPRVVWSNAAAQTFLKAASRDKLSRLVFGNPAVSRTMAARLERLKAGAPPHLERILLASGFRVEPLTLLCKAVDGSKSIVMQVVSVASGKKPAGMAAGGSRPATAPVELTGGSEALDPIDAAHPLALASPEAESRVPQERDAEAIVPEPAAQAVRRTAAEVAEEFLARFGAVPVRRFVWQTDGDGRLIDVGPDMAACFGATALRPGASLVASLDEIAPDEAARAGAAMEERHSFTGAWMAWPVENADATVQVTLGGTPRTGPAAGYRGFGVIHLDQISSPPLPEPVALPEPPEVDIASAPDVTGPPDEAAADPIPAIDDEIAARPDMRDEPAIDAGSIAAGAASPESAAGSRTDVDDQASSVDDGLGAASEPLPKAVPTPEAAQPSEPAERTETPSPAPSGAANVVHLSTFKTAIAAVQSLGRLMKPARPEPADDGAATIDPPLWSETPGPDPAPNGEARETKLSSNERYNFDEIARTLGAGPPALLDGETTQDDGEVPSGQRHGGEYVGSGALDTSSLLDYLPIGTIVSKGSRLVYANRTILELLGFDTVEAMIAAGGIERLFQGQAAGLMLENVASQPITITARDGETVAADVRLQTIAWQGEPATLMSIRRSLDREVSAQMSAVRLDLQKSQAETRDLGEALDFAVSGLGFLDLQGRILSINGGAERLFGYDQREVVGDLCEVLLAPDQKSVWTTFFNGFTATQAGGGRTTAFRRFAGRKRSGDALRLAASLKRVGTDKICILWNDDTHRNLSESEIDAARREAERSSSLKSEFLAKVSHEIRTPLNAILGFTEIIMEERFGPIANERYRAYLKDIHASGTHVMSLVNDLLDLSRIEAGGLDLKLIAVNPNVVVSESVATLQSQAHRDRIIIRSSLASRLPPVLADERALRQIVLNLLSNAVKFNEPGGQVIVSTAVTESGAVAIRVRDTGLGMSDEDIETAMKPFRQLSTPKASSGSGLGLPLTKALVDANHASMTIKSRPREGTLVEVMLQRAPSESVSLPAE